MIRSITSNILIVEKMRVYLSVNVLAGDDKPLINVFGNKNGYDYATINPSINVIMKYNVEGKPWSKTDQVYINQSNIFVLRYGLKSFYGKFNRDDLFIYDEHGYASDTNFNNDDFTVINLGKGQVLRLDPVIMYDDENKSLPGVSMRINEEKNEVNLSIDEFETMMEIFDKINIRLEGIMILQIYLSGAFKENTSTFSVGSINQETFKPTPKKGRVGNIFDNASRTQPVSEESKEYSSGPVKVVNNIKPTSLEDL